MCHLLKAVLSILFVAPFTIATSCYGSCSPPKSDTCTLVVRDMVIIEHQHFDDDDHTKNVLFECILNSADSGFDADIIVPLFLSESQEQILHSKLNKGIIISGVTTLMLDQNMQISPDEGIFIPVSTTRFSFGKGVESRRLGTSVGEKKTLVVKVIDSEGKQLAESTDQISDDVFGTYGDSMTLKSQMEACSYNKTTILVGNGDEHEESPGVIVVTLDVPLATSSPGTILNSAKREAQNVLGHRLPGPYSYVMFTLENCYKNCGWAAYAYRNNWETVYQGANYKYVGVMMHGKKNY